MADAGGRKILGGIAQAWLGVALLVVAGLVLVIPGSPFHLAGPRPGPGLLLGGGGLLLLILGLLSLRRGLLEAQRRMAEAMRASNREQGTGGWRDVTPEDTPPGEALSPPKGTLPPG